LIYESEVESESVKGDISSAAAAEVRRRSAEMPQKAQCGGATEGAVRRRHRGATEGAMRRQHRRRSAEVPQKVQVQWHLQRCHRRHSAEAPQKA